MLNALINNKHRDDLFSVTICYARGAEIALGLNGEREFVALFASHAQELSQNVLSSHALASSNREGAT